MFIWWLCLWWDITSGVSLGKVWSWVLVILVRAGRVVRRSLIRSWCIGGCCRAAGAGTTAIGSSCQPVYTDKRVYWFVGFKMPERMCDSDLTPQCSMDQCTYLLVSVTNLLLRQCV